MHVPAVGESAADQDGAAAKRIVARDVDAQVADGRHGVRWDGEEAAHRPDVIDPVHGRGIGNRNVRDGGGERGHAADPERGAPDDGVGVHGHVGGARDHDARDGGIGERAARRQRRPRDDQPALGARGGL